ncbi:craniofacial development protein 2-like [Rhopalosiphum padi]|uniref:craniofacial development protein 2-like n=1 Tax=Rhopalosiphum padi TaxID=40932 RepID=UPI00298E4E2B|nr:craniofacial development protein 2-like [Rhopalosiphum padi]
MIDEITRYKIPIVAIQEVRWLNSGSIQSGNSIIFYSGLQTGRHEKGVGFMIDKAMMNQVKKFVPVNERICYIRIAQQKLDLIILNCYAPTENADDEEKNSFYDTLEATFDVLPKNCIRLIVGDLNAQVGRETSFGQTIRKESWHLTTNNNGQKIIDFYCSKDLIISSTYFPRKNIYKHTWSAPDGKTKSQIDHIIIDKRHKTSIRNIKSYRGADGDTDHYLVVATFVLKLSVKWRKHDPDKVTLWSKTKKSLTKATERLRGKRTKQNENHWFNLECQAAINKRSLARQNMMLNPTEENMSEYSQLRTLANKVIRQQKRAMEKRAIEDIEYYKKEPRLFFKKCRSIKEGFKARTNFITDMNGHIISEPSEIVRKFQEYFEELLNSNNSRTGMDNNGKYEEILHHTAEPELPAPNIEEIEIIIFIFFYFIKAATTKVIGIIYNVNIK